MQLIVDANVLVAEAFRERGRALVTSTALDLFISVGAWDETTHELRRRAAVLIQRGVYDESSAGTTLGHITTAIASRLTISESDSFADRLPEALWRIPRDGTDAPTVALALALDCGIWTNDRDFFGCGLPVWSTEVLRSYLEQEASAS